MAGSFSFYSNSDHTPPQEPQGRNKATPSVTMFPVTAAQKAAQAATPEMRNAAEPGMALFGRPENRYSGLELGPLLKAIGSPDDQRESDAAQFRQVLYDAGLDANDAKQFTQLLVSAYRNPPGPEQSDKWAADTERRLGPMLAGQMAGGLKAGLRMANEYLRGQPLFRDVLKATGLANHPDAVQLMITAAQRARARKA